MSFLFLFIVLFTVALNSPSVLSADVRAETEMAGGGDASRMRENRRLTAGACEPGGRQIRQLYFDFLSGSPRFSFSFSLFFSFSFISHALVSIENAPFFFFLFCSILRARTFVFENFFDNEIE